MQFELNNIASQKGRVAIITGANTGLGFETALALARLDMHVVMACRDTIKAETALSAIQERTGHGKLEAMQLDLASLASVREFARRFKESHDRLDLLINNAGVMLPPYTLTEDDFELQFGVNHLAHFLLTGLLLDVLESTPDSRTVALGSLAHRSARINFDDLQSKKKYSGVRSYGQSKLACLMFAYELQHRLSANGYQTCAVAAHPGISASDLARHLPQFIQRYLAPLALKLVAQPAEKGALPILYAALGKDIEGGDYTGPDGRGERRGAPVKVESSKASHDMEAAARLWTVSEELTGISYPERRK